MTISVNVSGASYDIVLESGALLSVANIFDLNRKVCVVTDDGVPQNYAAEVANASKDGYIFTFKSGEKSKNLETYEELCKFLLLNRFSRYDCIVAVGGGSCADEMMAALRAGCDTFVTADVKYNQFWDAYDLGLNLIDAGHFYTENPVVGMLAEKIAAAFPEIEVKISETHGDCMKYY